MMMLFGFCVKMSESALTCPLKQTEGSTCPWTIGLVFDYSFSAHIKILLLYLVNDKIIASKLMLII